MKKLLFIILTGLIGSSYAQLTLSNQSDGVVAVSYGESNDYSIYDPQGDTEIYVYMWVDENQTDPNLSMQYNDEWGDAASLVVLTYDSAASKFTGTIDFTTHEFLGEGVLPDGTTLNNFNLILRNQAGDAQSADLLATDYGFQPTQILGMTEIDAGGNIFYTNGQLVINQDVATGNMQVQVFDISGKVLLDKQTSDTQIPLNVAKNTIIIVRVVLDNQRYFVKKIRL